MPRKMDIALSISGSSTKTFWKRRSKALSFSKYFWYSSRVVAPIARNSPRAKAGFRIFAASIAPAPPPAPTSVWISSINKTKSPSLLTTSLITDFKRSSNSPLYFAPAIKAPISRAKIFLPFKFSGTSPSIIRCAKPSAIAVFPVPGSPTKMGLFFVRRLKICNKRRISSSLPITGSSIPLFASSFKFLAYLFNALYDSSAVEEMTFSPFRSSCIIPFKFFLVIPWSFSMRPTELSDSNRAINRCSVATNSSCWSLAILSAFMSVCEAFLEIICSPPFTFEKLFKTFVLSCLIKDSSTCNFLKI